MNYKLKLSLSGENKEMYKLSTKAEIALYSAMFKKNHCISSTKLRHV